jgi:glycosidase
MFVCGWEQPETCWFREYLPDLDHRNDEVVEHLSEVALFWARELDLDGFRVDAVKHVHVHFWNTLRAKLDRAAQGSMPFLLLGETFVGAWGGGTGTEEALIKAYVAPDQLHGQFDFPLYWAIVQGLARDEIGLDQLGEVLLGTVSYHGPDTPMVAFMGNHDVPRFLSHAAGDIASLWGTGASQQGWQSPPEQPPSAAPYARQKLAHTLLAGGPWWPLIYYGDEVGLAGAGDPDNRRVFPWSGRTAHQDAVLAHARAAYQARRGSTALRRGSLEVLASSADTLALRRVVEGSQALVLLNRGTSSWQASLPVTGTTYLDALDQSSWQAVAGLLVVPVAAEGSRLLLEK